MPSRHPSRKDAVATRAALLRAAADVFAKQGFGEARVRTICDKAGVNLGAVSHYFGSKDALYREVLVTAHQALMDNQGIPDLRLGETGRDLEEAMGQWVHFALGLMVMRRPNHPHAGLLMAREISQPTGALDDLIKRFMRPVRGPLEEIIAGLLGSADEPYLRGQCANFVLGLCALHGHGREVLARFGYPVPKTWNQLDVLAQTVTVFALGGIDRLAHQSRGSAKGRPSREPGKRTARSATNRSRS